MLFPHTDFVPAPGVFRFSGVQCAVAAVCLNTQVARELWRGYSFHLSELTVSETDQLVFVLGDACVPEIGDGSYAISVTPAGVAVAAHTRQNLLYGYLTMLDMIRIAEDGDGLALPCGLLQEKPLIKTRMVHYCIFPETQLWELRKFLRFCGAVKYTHVVLEFWGMFRYDCLDALSWPHAFTKEELAPILQEARDLGMELVPMLNHWGHASQSRVMHGKHVVLDQDPRLAWMFDETGWRWAIEKAPVRDLLRKARQELMELCGDGEYLHIGCDEAYGFDFSDDAVEEILTYVNGIAEELKACGRKAIMWGDMLLTNRSTYSAEYIAFCPDEEREARLLAGLDPEVVIADWQYYAKTVPVETSVMLKNAGRQVLVSPWDLTLDCSNACIDTVKRYDLFGILHTTWHTLSKGFPYVSETAVAAWSDKKVTLGRPQTAEVLRKVSFADGDWVKAGWSKEEIGDIFE